MTHLAVDAWEALLRAHVTLIKEFAEDFRGERVSMAEYDVLYTLTGFPGGTARLGELAATVRLSQPGLSRLIERMEGEGLVRRERDPLDGRGTLVGLTADGRAAQLELGRRHSRSIVARVGTALSPAEQAELKRLCLKLRARAEGPGQRAGDALA
ncbi:MarR family winged helix-turn-helix transcriptional regulator [Pengzhenrongella sicca]|uniref:MarR family transcriptional regulator n=1 Tax=Pengzhenrongella sicca TaxID=2819238 RepID=A0A8A4ZC97_9MICO|nr:MarR family transcriptional regulator [Pengzhenrongella sicca]QTE29552.1 MarR family transcriptional regulator [Pengzhenrongella sicca]